MRLAWDETSLPQDHLNALWSPRRRSVGSCAEPPPGVDRQGDDVFACGAELLDGKAPDLSLIGIVEVTTAKLLRRLHSLHRRFRRDFQLLAELRHFGMRRAPLLSVLVFEPEKGARPPVVEPVE